MKKKCKFCGKILSPEINSHNYQTNNPDGKFYECKSCKVLIQPKKFNNLYVNQNSSNYNLNKNFFYYLKQIILLYSIFRMKNFFYNKKDILDYGSGSGELAVALSIFFKKKNIFTSDVFKLEKKFIPKIKRHYLLHKGELKNKKFDVILMRHVFEHILNLSIFMKKIKKNLKNDRSILLIEVPNMDSIWRKLMRRRWPGYFFPFHYYVFSNDFLSKYFSKNGFEVIAQKKLEPPIFGSFLLTYGINGYFCKLLSIFIYPFQYIISKLFLSSEAILLAVKKK